MAKLMRSTIKETGKEFIFTHLVKHPEIYTLEIGGTIF
jgi:hypothetical protein